MYKKLDFTTDTARFGDQAAMVKELHNRGMKYIVIVVSITCRTKLAEILINKPMKY